MSATKRRRISKEKNTRLPKEQTYYNMGESTSIDCECCEEKVPITVSLSSPNIGVGLPNLAEDSGSLSNYSPDSDSSNAKYEYNTLSIPSSTEGNSQTSSLSDKTGKMEKAVRTLIECIGEDPDRPGLRKTPSRVVKALLECNRGYLQTPKDIVADALFDVEDSNPSAVASTCERGMVVVKDITLHSTCEHHMLPFFGHVHIGYIPRKGGKVIGLSKLARLSEVFARRLQIQERLSAQIADAVYQLVDAEGVAVMIEASHMCMVMRGVTKPGSVTITRAMCGSFKGAEGAELRAEFFGHINKR